VYAKAEASVPCTCFFIQQGLPWPCELDTPYTRFSVLWESGFQLEQQRVSLGRVRPR
jgi:hypothetical protein